MPEYSHGLKIPKDRVAVLIGQKGKTKRELQSLTGTKINVDSREGEVIISGDDPVKLYELRDVIRAIGRGFNPDIARLLLKQDFVLETVNIMDYVKDRKNHLVRVRGRVIGTEGKTRQAIENISETFISIYGKTVAIIGKAERVGLARHAVESLLRGAPHGNVYQWLERNAMELKKQEMLR